MREKNTISRYIRYNRELQGMTLAQLAEKIGSSVGHIGNIERGTAMPSNELMLRIADALQISFDAMLISSLDYPIPEDMLRSEDFRMMAKVFGECDEEDRDILLQLLLLMTKLLRQRKEKARNEQ